MHKLELLLRKYENNFLLLDDIINNMNIDADNIDLDNISIVSSDSGKDGITLNI